VFDDMARRDRGGAGRYTYVRRCAAARAGDGETLEVRAVLRRPRV